MLESKLFLVSLLSLIIIIFFIIYIYNFNYSKIEAKRLDRTYGETKGIRKHKTKDLYLYVIERREKVLESGVKLITIELTSPEIEIKAQGFDNDEYFNLKEKLIFKRLLSIEQAVVKGDGPTIKNDVEAIVRINENEYI